MPDLTPPAKEDLDRSVGALLEDRFQELLEARGRIISEFIAAGGSSSARLPLTIADTFYKRFTAVAGDAIERALPYLSAAKGVGELSTWIRPHLEKFKARLLEHITGGTGNISDVQRAYEPKYQKRIDDALQDLAIGIVKGAQIAPSGRSAPNVALANADNYVAQERLAELGAIKSQQYDLRKLVRICEELNLAWTNGSYYSVAALVRTLLDHIPPLFGQPHFAAVVASTAGKSMKAQFSALETAARNNADLHLHEQIGPRMTLPTATQVDQRSYLDHLLGEIVKRLT